MPNKSVARNGPQVVATTAPGFSYVLLMLMARHQNSRDMTAEWLYLDGRARNCLAAMLYRITQDDKVYCTAVQRYT